MCGINEHIHSDCTGIFSLIFQKQQMLQKKTEKERENKVYR